MEAVIGCGRLALQHMLVVDGNDWVGGEGAAQLGEAGAGSAVRIRDEHHDRIDPAALGLLHVADFLDHLEEFVVGMKAEVDHLADAVIDDQPLHQVDLAERVHDVSGLGDAGQEVDQRGFLQIEVEAHDVVPLQQQEFRQQPRQQGLADKRAGRTDDENGRAAHVSKLNVTAISRHAQHDAQVSPDQGIAALKRGEIWFAQRNPSS